MKHTLPELKARMAECHVIVSEIQNIYDPVFEKLNIVLIDEAAQCMEPLLLKVLDYNPEKLVMAGDFNQLNAYVASPIAK